MKLYLESYLIDAATDIIFLKNVKIVEIKGTVHLILVAKRDIKEGEELLYDYGDRTPLTVANNPWLLNS